MLCCVLVLWQHARKSYSTDNAYYLSSPHSCLLVSMYSSYKLVRLRSHLKIMLKSISIRRFNNYDANTRKEETVVAAPSNIMYDVVGVCLSCV